MPNFYDIIIRDDNTHDPDSDFGSTTPADDLTDSITIVDRERIYFPERHRPSIPRFDRKMKLVERSDPVRVVTIKGKRIRSVNISNLVTSVEINQTEDKHDTCTIRIENLTIKDTMDPIFNARTKAEIYFGYLSEGIHFVDTFILDQPEFSMEDTVVCTLNGKDISLAMSESEEQEVFHGMSDFEVAQRIAKKYNVLLSTTIKDVRDPLFTRKRDSIVQAGIPDWQFLRERALLYGFALDIRHYIIGNKRQASIYYGSVSDQDSGVILSYRDVNPLFCNLMSFRPKEKTYRRGCAVRYGTGHRNRLAKKHHFLPPEDPDREGPIQEIPGEEIEIDLDETLFGDGDPDETCHINDRDHPLKDSFNRERDYLDIIQGDSGLPDFKLIDDGEIPDRPIDVDDPINEDDHNHGSDCRKMIISNLGHENDHEEVCRVTRKIHESLQFVIEAEAEAAVGDPRIRKGNFVKVIGVGKYSGRYYIKTARHTFDSNGYRVSASLKSRGTRKNSDQKLKNPKNPDGGGSGNRDPILIEEHRTIEFEAF